MLLMPKTSYCHGSVSNIYSSTKRWKILYNNCMLVYTDFSWFQDCKVLFYIWSEYTASFFLSTIWVSCLTGTSSFHDFCNKHWQHEVEPVFKWQYRCPSVCMSLLHTRPLALSWYHYSPQTQSLKRVSKPRVPLFLGSLCCGAYYFW